MECRYSAVQTLGTVDGPGVRFVLFLQGCPLHCGYCHNPETREPDKGNTASAQEILSQILRCRSFFGKNGGVTVSGGEPLMQADFVRELFTLCKQHGIHTAVDTSGCILNDSVIKMLEVTDLCILDIKMTNDADYRKHIGCSLSGPLNFLDALERMEVPVWIRQVIVEGINDSAENAAELDAICSRYTCVKRVQLLPFRKMCVSKYEELGIEFPFGIYPETKQSRIDELSALIYKTEF